MKLCIECSCFNLTIVIAISPLQNCGTYISMTGLIRVSSAHELWSRVINFENIPLNGGICIQRRNPATHQQSSCSCPATTVDKETGTSAMPPLSIPDSNFTPSAVICLSMCTVYNMENGKCLSFAYQLNP